MIPVIPVRVSFRGGREGAFAPPWNHFAPPWHSHIVNYKYCDREIGNGTANFGCQIAPETVWEDLNSKNFLGEDPRPPFITCCLILLCPPKFQQTLVSPPLGKFSERNPASGVLVASSYVPPLSPFCREKTRNSQCCKNVKSPNNMGNPG